ncbi:MAG: UDP-glucose--hexose-1-phosphate uridylyltransferase [Oscillospiraceae bacterium]|nr:UDP-glucose--hexose-1-phosphate uridylyltransferase [Oscillospiraceae bacterium]
MKIETCIDSLVSYAMNCGLAEPVDHQVLLNRLLDLLRLDGYEPSDEAQTEDLEEILKGILDYACEKGLCEDNITARDIFDTRVMGAVTPMPREIVKTFWDKYDKDPVAATDWYYKLSCDTDYIRRYRIARDMRWKYDSDYGEIDITINLSKPEKDPRAIAAAKNAPQSGYPKCQLCRENEGYAGRMNHPARANHRIIPIEVAGKNWCLQYSPYVYYNEHCIVFNAEHIPMKIDRAAFEKLLDFVTLFPHYFVGSNADLPIVGGSILSHEHFQGGHYTFAMEKAPAEMRIAFEGYEDVEAAIVKWPMSVIRLSGKFPERIAQLGEKILNLWRGYSDAEAGVVAFSDGEPHNTITPIARRREGLYELDLVLRCNITSDEHPMGVFHPHADKHHIKKENIGLIEVMGLAVLPSRLKKELGDLKNAILSGSDIVADEVLCKHAAWVEELKDKYSFTEENALEILMRETGSVFAAVLEDAGVYKCTEEGRRQFLKFVDEVNAN